MELYIPHSIFHLARLLYVRPETFGPYYVHENEGKDEKCEKWRGKEEEKKEEEVKEVEEKGERGRILGGK